MTVAQKERLREVLIDYLHLLTSTNPRAPKYDRQIAEVRLLLKEVV